MQHLLLPVVLLGTRGGQECEEKGSSFHTLLFQAFSDFFFFFFLRKMGGWGEELESKDVQ